MPPNLERKPHQRKNPKRLLKTKLYRTNRPKRITGVTRNYFFPHLFLMFRS